jgi:hypothetical protein
LILQTRKDPSARLWSIPSEKGTRNEKVGKNYESNAIIHHQYQAEAVAFYHATFGSPTHSTFERALRKGYLSCLEDVLTVAMIRRNRSLSEATAKGHLDLLRQGLQSTRTINETTNWPLTMNFDEESDSEIGTEIGEVSDEIDTLYTDATGNLPMAPQNGPKFLLIASFRRYIHVTAMKTHSEDEYLEVIP